MLKFENKLWSEGKSLIAGIDEVGRGPLCGPVVSSAVILPKKLEIQGINDSKKLSAKKRSSLFDTIKNSAIAIGVGVVYEDVIDDINILESTILSMRKAIEDLNITPDVILVDGNIKDLTDIKQMSIIKGDSKSQSIAAASIVAKVTRDRMMQQYDLIFPGYGLSRNMGYGTREHIRAIRSRFSTPIHRRSFNPVSDYIPQFEDIRDIGILSVELAAIEMVKSGHEILRIKDKTLKTIDIISSFNKEFYAFKLHDSDNSSGLKNTMIREAQCSLSQADIKKDITSSINISVISIQFSKNKPRVIFKKL